MANPVFLRRIATAVPGHDVHFPFVAFADGMLQNPGSRALFQRMAQRSGIEHRYSALQVAGAPDAEAFSAYELYQLGSFPFTARRMALFKRFAPVLMRTALDRLALTPAERDRVRHVIVTSCTGLYAPGLDFEAMEHLGLPPSTERTVIGFMGCYAAVNALKQARHIVRSEPADSVLVINLELCTLHLQETQDLGQVLSFLVFGDGCAASLVSGEQTGKSTEPGGLCMDSFHALQLEGTRDLIRWDAGDQGFDMVLSGQVPGEIYRALRAHREDIVGTEDVALWAVHPGGRSVLDAVADALLLPADALDASRAVLRQFGNMSSATVMFVLERMMRDARARQRGVAMSFGPGLTAETMRFHVKG
ncbi:MAG: type III polyketide synthase [Janthinobacterium lividum]